MPWTGGGARRRGRACDDDRPIRVDELSLVPSERPTDLGGHILPPTGTEFGMLHHLMHHGTVTAGNHPEGGLIVRVTLPAEG